MKNQINERGCYTQWAKEREDGNMRINDPYQSHYPVTRELPRQK